MTKEVLICPNCNRPVTASEFMNPAVLGALESILPIMNCDCGYSGLPVKTSIEDYKKLIDASNKDHK